jgi:hypothetical protein
MSTDKVLAFDSNLKGIHDLFSKAGASVKNPRIKLQHSEGKFVLSLISEGRRYAGEISVTSGGAYEDRVWYGRITQAGEWKPTLAGRECAKLEPTLRCLARDPKTTMEIIGKRYGLCCLCGRELTNRASIEQGIGPICIEKFAL